MISKAPGAVGCAHCKQQGAVAPCPACHLLVCSACLRNLTTCDVPHARELRLGATARLRRVSEDGRYGVVSRWHRSPRLVDLEQADYLRSLPSVELSTAIGAVTREGRYLWVDKPPEARDDYAPAAVLSIGVDDDVPAIESRIALSRYAPFQICRGERMLYAVDFEASRVSIGDLDAGALHVLEPLPPRELLQACLVAADAGLLFTGAYGHVYVHRLAGGEAKKVGTIDLPDADIIWLGFARGRLAVVSGRTHEPSSLTVFALGDRWAGWQTAGSIRRLAPQPHPFDQPHSQIVAALSDDARFFAVALEDRAVLVHDLETDTRAVYEGHSDDLCLIAFSETAACLITADRDNRVRIRPRSGRHFLDTFLPARKL